MWSTVPDAMSEIISICSEPYILVLPVMLSTKFVEEKHFKVLGKLTLKFASPNMVLYDFSIHVL